jgi:MtN3 and saliva related transmembrane protein
MILLAINASIVGIAAGVLTSTSLMPQLFKMMKEKSGKDISIAMILVLMSGLALWVCYGVMKDDLPIIITNSFAVLVNIAILVLRIKYKDQ